MFSDLRKFDKDNHQPILINSTTSDDSANQNQDKYVNVCYGKEWYRYPSSFFLPSSKRYRLRFIKSDFSGQLPKLYDGDSKSRGLETRIIHDDFNNMNKEELSRYIDPSRCHYLIDSSQAQTSDLEPDYSRSIKDWKVLSSHKMLDLHNSPIVIRSFYLPFFSAKRNHYNDFRLLRNNNLFFHIQEGKDEK